MRTDWTRDEVSETYHRPLLDLLCQAQSTHREFHHANEIQMCRLLSIKTGGCPEDCAYCPQSAHHPSSARTPLMDPAEIVIAARAAKTDGATRFCMGAAWRQAPEGDEFGSIILRVGIVKAPYFTTFAGQKVRILRGSVAVSCRTCAVPEVD